MRERRLNPRKLLVASVGVATLNYLGTTTTACGGDVSGADGKRAGVGDAGHDGASPPPGPTVANLMPPPGPTVANLMPPPPPPPTTDAGRDAGGPRPPPTVANLMPPPPPMDASVRDAAKNRDGANGG